MVEQVIKYEPRWVLRKYESDEAYEKGKSPYEVQIVEGNMLLQEGILALCNLLVGNAATAFSQANAYIGVGDDGTTAEARTQTGLQATTNKAWVQCDASYPTITDRDGDNTRVITWRGVFDGSTANFAWNEFTVNNSAAADDTGDNLNRKVSSQGTKTSGQTWTLDLEVKFS